jgi:hypothetical protein
LLVLRPPRLVILNEVAAENEGEASGASPAILPALIAGAVTIADALSSEDSQ